ncbi:MAG: hypothetical protein ABIR15_01285 [Chitinophagaceae bacterium]
MNEKLAVDILAVSGACSYAYPTGSNEITIYSGLNYIKANASIFFQFIRAISRNGIQAFSIFCNSSTDQGAGSKMNVLPGL